MALEGKLRDAFVTYASTKSSPILQQSFLDWVFMAYPEAFLAFEKTEDGTIFADIRSLLKEGNKLDAIKTYRTRTGVSLAQAKEWVERFAKIQDLVHECYTEDLEDQETP